MTLNAPFLGLGSFGLASSLMRGVADAATREAPPRKPDREAPPLQRRLVVIDPGHGGHDPGAIGVRGAGLHTLNEHIFVDSLPERGRLMAGLLATLS